MPLHFPQVAVHLAVSIRARHCCRAMPRSRAASQRDEEFQSAPGIAAGRCVRNRAPCQSARGFNPRPALLPGDAALSTGITVSVRCFNPRPALLPGDATGDLSHTTSIESFNPRPALLPGDATIGAIRGRYPPVSIRARHCCRAMPMVIRVIHRLSLFQSAPGIAAGRCARN